MSFYFMSLEYAKMQTYNVLPNNQLVTVVFITNIAIRVMNTQKKFRKNVFPLLSK